MSAGASVSLIWTLLSVCLHVWVRADQKNITAETGETVTLTCQAPNNNIIVVKWSRADLEPEYVFLYRDGRPEPDDQHPSFVNRVDLRDRQMKDGDVSLILKKARINDTGTYECRVLMRGTNRKNTKPISIINLSVVPPGQPERHREDGGKENGSVPLIFCLIVSAVYAGIVGYVIFTICRQRQ